MKGPPAAPDPPARAVVPDPLAGPTAAAGPSEQLGRSDLDRSLIHGIAWTGTVKTGAQVLTWLSTLALARLLTPLDYGLVGAATIYTGFVQLMTEFGLSAAIIQQRELDESRTARLGGLAILVGLAFCLVSAAVSPLVARFFTAPPVRWIVTVLSVKFVLDSVGVVPRALLARELRFNRLALVEGAESLALTAVALSTALLGARYWALVLGVLASGVVGNGLALAMRRHRVAWPSDLRGLRGSIRFGRDVMISRIAWYSYSNADFAVVGRVLDKVALGAYTFAWNIASIPVEKVSALVGRVTPAIFASVQHDKAALRRYLLVLSEGIALVTFPLSVGLALTGDHFVLAVLGEKWRGAIVPLQLLAFYGGFRSIATLNAHILIATGKAAMARRFSVVAALVLPVAFLIGSRWGTRGVALAWIFGYPLCVVPLDFRYTFRLLELSAGRYFAALWAPLSAAATMGAAVIAVRLALRPAPLFGRLLAEVATGAAVYVAVVWVAHRERVAALRGALARARASA